MPGIPLTPLRFEPILRRLIWGGRRLGTVLHKAIGEGNDYAESWELSDYRDAVSVVCEGELAGITLRDLVRQRGRELMGPELAGRDQFPLLVKFIDAREVLSVQVHPDDEKGQELAGDNGKTETWVIVAADPGSLIYAGLKPGVTREAFAAAIATGQVEPLLHRFPARPGDCIMIEAGTVHAIGAGVLLAEIQQMSDATFRIHDWGRVGADGRPRELHVQPGPRIDRFHARARRSAGPRPGANDRRECSGAAVAVPLFRARSGGGSRGPVHLGATDRFTILMSLEGEAEVRHQGQETRLAFGQTPAAPGLGGALRGHPRRLRDGPDMRGAVSSTHKEDPAMVTATTSTGEAPRRGGTSWILILPCPAIQL